MHHAPRWRPLPGASIIGDRGGETLESWQLILGVFLVLLPIVLMVDYWGDERLTARGRPIPREWRRQVDHDASHDEH